MLLKYNNAVEMTNNICGIWVIYTELYYLGLFRGLVTDCSCGE